MVLDYFKNRSTHGASTYYTSVTVTAVRFTPNSLSEEKVV